MADIDEELDPGLHRRRIDGISYIERPGPGDTVVLLHGVGSSARSFLPMFPFLPAHLRVIAWDTPGYGTSERLSVDIPATADYARAVKTLCDGLDLEKPHVVGHSMGTLIATAFAILAPERVASLTLAASAQGYGMKPGDPLPAKAHDRLVALDELGPAAFAAGRAHRLIHEPDKNPQALARAQAEMARLNPKGYGQAVNMLARGDLAGMMASLTREPGFITGAEDQITPFSQTEGVMTAWTKAHGTTPRCINLPAAGHALHAQVPEGFANALMDLVPALQSTGGEHGK